MISRLVPDKDKLIVKKQQRQKRDTNSHRHKQLHRQKDKQLKRHRGDEKNKQTDKQSAQKIVDRQEKKSPLMQKDIIYSLDHWKHFFYKLFPDSGHMTLECNNKSLR